MDGEGGTDGAAGQRHGARLRPVVVAASRRRRRPGHAPAQPPPPPPRGIDCRQSSPSPQSSSLIDLGRKSHPGAIDLFFFPHFTEFYRVFFLDLPSFTKFYVIVSTFTKIYLVLPSFTEFYRVLPSFHTFKRFLPSFTEFFLRFT